VKSAVRLAVPLMMLFFSSIACGLSNSSGPERNAIIINLAANSNVHAWLETAIGNFNDADYETASGVPIFIEYRIVESGQSVANMISGESVPDLWIPDDMVWTDVLADKGIDVFTEDCMSVAESPLVIAMWKPIAEALGWPGRELGWLDVGSLAADPSAWDYYSGGQYGDSLRLGHTHPGLSASGTGTLLSLVQAAQSKTEAVQPEEIELHIVQARFHGSAAVRRDLPRQCVLEGVTSSVQRLSMKARYTNTVLAKWISFLYIPWKEHI
jgi:Ca-activated chloride channel family protein